MSLMDASGWISSTTVMLLLSGSAAVCRSVGGAMQPGELTLWAMQPYGSWVITSFCRLLTGTETRSDHLPLQPPVYGRAAAVSSPGCPSPKHISPLPFPFSSVDSLHSSSFFLIHLCEMWRNSNVELEKRKPNHISGSLFFFFHSSAASYN